MAAVNLPDNPANGTTQTVGGITYTYNSSKGYWTAAASSGGGGGGGSSVSTSDAAPSSPSDGDLWYDTDDGGMFVYYQDTDSSQWVEVIGSQGNAGPAGAAGAAASASYANFAAFPGSPTEGDIAYAQDTNALYVYDGSSWDRISSGSDESPRVTTEPATSHTLNSDGSTSTLTMVAEDPEGFDIEYAIKYNTSGGALPSQLASATTINQSTGVFTFTPTTTTSNAGTFNARLTASDGNRVTVRTVPFSLVFYPNSSNVVGRYEFFNTASYNPSSSTTALTDISTNTRNITIGNPGAHSSDGLLTFTQGSTTMNFTGNQDSKTWMILFRPPTGWDRSLFWGDGGANATYYAAFRSTTAEGTAYSGWSTAWSGETVTNYVNGTNIGTSRINAYNALEHAKVNSVITTGLQFPSTYLVYAQHSGYIITHEVYAIVFWDAVLTATEVQAAHNYYRNIIGSSNMAAWSG